MTVLVLVEIDVLVLGVVDVVVAVVVVVVVVVGLSVDVVAGVSVVVPGSALCVTVSVPPVGAGSTEPSDGDDDGDDDVAVDDVPEGLDASPSVNDTMAYTITATTITAIAPRLTRPAGRRYQGVGGAGGGCWPYSGCCPYGSCAP